MFEVGPEILKTIYQPRPPEAIKYDFGLLLVIGGSEFYSGSPALAAFSAFKSGIDMVKIIAPKRAADIVASFSPDLAAFPLKGDRLNKGHLTTLITMTQATKTAARGKAAVVIGGGMGRSEETQKAILKYLQQVSIPAVIDADAIHALAKKPEILKENPFLITPHGYEFYVLTGKEVIGKSDQERIDIVREEAGRLGCIILLKGRVDIISDGKEVALNKTGSSYMTTGGCGDTLAGICGSLVARGINPWISAQAAAYINGKAGEMAAKKYGEGLLATDLIQEIPQAIKCF